MKTIDITSTHNVVIRYELASIGIRWLATIIDLIILGVLGTLLIMFIGIFLSTTAAAVISTVIIGLYHFFIESFNFGQSIGKKMLNLNVVNLKGQNPSIYQCFLRWIFRMVDITLSFGMLGSLFMLSSDRNQRIGDHFAHTTVIKNKKKQFTSLDKIIEIDTREREIIYPQIASFEEHEIIFIKDVLNRTALNPTAENKELMKSTAKLMAQKLKITEGQLDAKSFLSDLIIDYVYLSR